jgi:hypothetical protein
MTPLDSWINVLIVAFVTIYDMDICTQSIFKNYGNRKLHPMSLGNSLNLRWSIINYVVEWKAHMGCILKEITFAGRHGHTFF